MRAEEVPKKTKVIGSVCSDLKAIIKVLRDAFPHGLEQPLSFVACVRANKFACIVYAQKDLLDMARLDDPIKTLEVLAENLMRNTKDSYHKTPAVPGKVNGWEIKVA